MSDEHETEPIKEIVSVMDYIKLALVVVKCVFMLYKFAYCILRYKRTYKIWNQFEIWIFMASFILIVLILIFELTGHNINALFASFFLNSLINMFSSYHLHNKVLSALYTQ
jgi:hypothetical protein